MSSFAAVPIGLFDVAHPMRLDYLKLASDQTIQELAQNGHGVKRAPQRPSGFLLALGARVQVLCAREKITAKLPRFLGDRV
jgi:hypothetical protein